MKALNKLSSFPGSVENFIKNVGENTIGATQTITQAIKIDPNLLNPLSLKWDQTGKTYNNRWIRLSVNKISEVNTPNINAIVDTMTSQASATWKDIVNNVTGNANANTLSTGVKYDDYIFYNCDVFQSLEKNTTTVKVANYGDIEFKNQGAYTIYEVTMNVPPVLKGIHPNVDVVRAVQYLYNLNSELYIQAPRLEATTLQDNEKVVFTGQLRISEPIQDLLTINFALKTVKPKPKYIKVQI